MSHEPPRTQAAGFKIKRRTFVTGAASTAGLAIGAGGMGGCAASSLGRSSPGIAPATHRIPDAAYVRTLGAVAPGICHPLKCANGVGFPGLKEVGAALSIPGLGLPMGGIGAGSFMINQCGTFGPWDMGGEPTTSHWEQRTLSQAAFHVREEVVGGSGPTIKTLAVNHDNPSPDRRLGTVLPAWNTLKPGDGTYAVLYPFAWVEYTAFQAKISTKLWSPIIANDDERLSMPVAFFDTLVSNPTDKPIKLALMFTFPNAPAFASGEASQRVRTGFYSRYDSDPAAGIGGVTLGADSPTNSPNSFNSEWTIAARPFPGQAISYCSSWNAAGDGADICAPFSESGTLPNRDIDASKGAGAIAVSLTLQSGETQTVRFALAWDFPQHAYSHTVWMRRYTAFLGARSTATNDYIPGSYPFKQAFNIARKELARYDNSLAAVEAWWKPIAENPNTPAWLRKAALNELYHMGFNGALWEAGLVSTTLKGKPELGSVPRWGSAIPGTHIYYKRDGGNGGTPQHEMDMDSSGYLVQAKLFRGMERGFIVPCLQGVRQNPIGIGRVLQQTFTDNGPFITTTHTHQDRAANSPPVFGVNPPGKGDLGEIFWPPGGDSFRDCPHKLIFRTYAQIKFYNDDELLKYAYLPMLRALKYVQFFRPKGSHLPWDPPSNNPPNTMDQVIVDGHGIYNCGYYLLSLQIMSAITSRAMALGVPEATSAELTAIDQELIAAKAEFEQVFWNPRTGRYRLSSGTGGLQGRTGDHRGRFKPVPTPDDIYLESFAGQNRAMELGLPDIVNLDRARTHLNNTLHHFIRFRDPQGRLMGGPIILKPDFSIYPSSLKTTEINEVIPGIAWLAAAGAYRIGKKVGDEGIMQKALQLAEGCAIRIFDDENGALAFNSPESWFVDDAYVDRFPAYTRTRSVFSMVDAVSPIAVAQPA